MSSSRYLVFSFRLSLKGMVWSTAKPDLPRKGHLDSLPSLLQHIEFYLQSSLQYISRTINPLSVWSSPVTPWESKAPDWILHLNRFLKFSPVLCLKRCEGLAPVSLFPQLISHTLWNDMCELFSKRFPCNREAVMRQYIEIVRGWICSCMHRCTHRRACVNLHSCGRLSVLKWLPSKWNVPRRPWFYKETGGWWEEGKDEKMKSEMGVDGEGK